MISPTRFRADPARVRVSIRRVGDVYSATITERGDCPLVIIKQGRTPRAAVMRALRAAHKHRMRGVDFGMQWSYPHPWGDERSTCFAPTLPSAGAA
jgi:hypothetical protein